MLLILLIGILAACRSDSEQSASTVPVPGNEAATVTPVPTPARLSYVDTGVANGGTALRCEECRAVEVTEVIGPETVVTAEGPVRLYGAFVAPEEENCVTEATDRLRELASDGVLLMEEGTLATDSSGTPIRYMYTDSGDSVEELFITEGLARRSAFDGPHAPWLLITADNARRDRSGCIWENFDRMFPQRTPRSSGGIN